MLRKAVSLAVSRSAKPNELLLVERSKKLRAFAGMFAFPGGVVDEDDKAVLVSGEKDPEVALSIVTGARELFEETGIWLGRGGVPPSKTVLDADRRRLLAQEISIQEILVKYGQYLDARDFQPFCRLRTPPFSPICFDTVFLRCLVDEEAKVEIWEGELVGGSFVEPTCTLEEWRQGTLQIAPPMIMFLKEWSSGHRGAEQRIFEISDSYDRGNLPRVYFTPGILLVPLKTPTRLPATHTNTLIVGENILYLVDPSPSDFLEQERLWELLDGLVAEGRTIAGILLTHYHRDHVGALSEMQNRYKVPAFAHVDCMNELKGADFGEPLSHGDVLNLGIAPDGSSGWALTTYHVPGHARGHLAFQDTRYGALLVGDLVSSLSSILIDPKDGHLSTYLNSLQFLHTVAKNILYPGHGPPVQDGARLIETTIEHRADRERQLLESLNDIPQTAQTLVKEIYGGVPEDFKRLAQRSLLSGLIKLKEEGLVCHVASGYKLTQT